MTVATLPQEDVLEYKRVWKNAFPSPIHVFNVELFGVPIAQFVNEQRLVFDALPADPYDARKEQIEFLKQHSKSEKISECDFLFKQYYTGKEPLSCLSCLYDKLPDDKKQIFAKIIPYRFRAISRYQVDFAKDGSQMKRIETGNSFVQKDKLLEDGKFDYRTLPRIFENLDEEFSSLPLFQKTVLGVSSIIHKTNPNIRGLDITIHHVRVKTSINRITSNSPEGIHQDGFPFIVSALVVERVGIEGGESQVFGDDRDTKIFTTTLMPGFGLLQPDLNTLLWHCVSKMSPVQTDGYRSSIGFDIQPIYN